MKRFGVCLIIASTLAGGAVHARPRNPLLARQWWQRLDLSEHVGQTYLPCIDLNERGSAEVPPFRRAPARQETVGQ